VSGPHSFEALNDVQNFAGAQVFGYPMNPAVAEDVIRVSEAAYQKPAHYRMAPGRGFHALGGQQQHTRFDFMEVAFLHRWQGRKRLATRAPPALLTDLHAQHAAVHAAPQRVESLVWMPLHCGCRHGIGSTLRCSGRLTRPVAALRSKCPSG
jgi:hypothetical protein